MEDIAYVAGQATLTQEVHEGEEVHVHVQEAVSVVVDAETGVRPQARETEWRGCEMEGCNRPPRGNARFCTSHSQGSSRKCRMEGCEKASRGVEGLCVAHGGGKRCNTEGCSKAARGSTGKCVRHGGGPKCVVEGCTKAARGVDRKCTVHGGGIRCSYPECNKASRGKSGLCTKHGGGRRCQHLNCSKAARSKSQFCSVHGKQEVIVHEPIQQEVQESAMALNSLDVVQMSHEQMGGGGGHVPSIVESHHDMSAQNGL